MAENKKNLNENALNENDLENVSGGVADWRNEQARAADRDRAGRVSMSKNTKNGVQSKNIMNTQKKL
ncbi:MAG: hypothetical protein E7308_00125 [Butyrivibrio sp.]|nr:hypothetical protein [Butyrivibrio sp.]